MKTPLRLIVILTCAAGAAPFVSCASPSGTPRVVAARGVDASEAPQAEGRRKAPAQTDASPLPAGPYEIDPEELGLINPRPNAHDAALGELCRRYAQSTAPERARMRKAISREEFYILLSFASRAAVFGLRERKAARLADGLTAVSMVEEARVDFRDLLMPLGLLHHSARRVGADPAKLFRDAARLAEPGTRKLMLEFLSRPAELKDLRTAWGYDEVETEGGVGFIDRGFEPYNPTSDLKRLAVDIARLVAADGKYGSALPSIGDDLPAVWLETGDDAALQRVLRTVRAGARVSAELKPDLRSRVGDQQFTVFVVETADEAGARTLLDISKRKRDAGVAMLALAERRLFCLVVARAIEYGRESFETNESLSRFKPGLAEILRRHAKS